MTIKRLPQDVVDRIAAGEVVERPSAVIKELLENALDARATSLDVTLEGGGLGLLRVADDGVGIAADELPVAFASHATSKLVDVDDLFHIVSFGFRGEALSSIGAVSRCRIVSSTGEDGVGHRLDCVAGQLGEVEPVAARRGTVVEVRDLFFNTPARREFLGSARAETARCREVCTALSLVHPDVHVRLTVDGQQKFNSAPSEDTLERVATVYGRDFAAGLTRLAARRGGLELEGFLTLPAAARPRARTQQLFVNGRLVKDKQVLAAVRVACRDFIPPSLQPSWILFLTVDPTQVDVNVHPTKAEVRFRDPDELFKLVHHACRDALLGADLAPRVKAEHLGPESTGTSPASGGGAGANGGATAAPDHPGTRPLPRPSFRAPAAGGASTDLAGASPVHEAPATPAAPAGEQLELGATTAGAPSMRSQLRPAARYLQVLDTYLAHDTPDGLVLVDQHALHERILYARLQDQLGEGKLPTQALLVPQPVRLDPALHAQALEKAEELAHLGLEIEDFGQDTVVVRSVPAVLRHEKLDDLVVALVAPPDLHGGIPSGLDRRLFTMACHAAVKAGDPLKEDEIAELLEQGEALEHDSSCPHGRPTRLVIGRTELERLFKRNGF